ncbi:tricarballylate utilization 4Fe-4S protein TcuB [Thiorhodococcus mannitoliphagus]|uniref:Tricarballylate utilization 4Fe-4S protein TcuB n=1 Tax=Thiorhodococcus mannitoliphagus TaxID=329406 RepID=A0A6P1DNY7_9GAMM|nr:tricarballylate utilization 4Fe-4S protein TcuB [Thiorhodococcus mannitoliphagus]NEX19967.1 tricarballylate utilization 4Fe-4S protein TcuB [Thiorhodococcus mannitoliphagus]
MPSDERRTEARRVLGICNACGYCNGLCDLFEAAKHRPRLADGDLAHLANLCHGCRSCLYACQYAPPHGFAVNVPRALAEMRHQSYADYAWPRAFAGLLERGVLTAVMVGLGAVGLLLALVLWSLPHDILFAQHTGPGAFYRIMPWGWMLVLGLLPLAWSMLAFGMGLHRYWRAARTEAVTLTLRALLSALRDVLLLRNLSGGGPGCNDLDEQPSHKRRWIHQGMVLGLLLSFAATGVATYYHHALGWEAPYPLTSAPVVLGTLGGLLMSAAIAGLLWLKRHGDREPTAAVALKADYALLVLLLSVALTGLALLLWRETAAMGLLLAIHLGSVLAFFLLMPYSKLVHAGYRFIALLVEASERTRQRDE